MSYSRPVICFVAPNAFPLLTEDQSLQVIGGAELQQVIVARELVKRGYKVLMICLDFGQDDQVEVDGITVFRAFRRDAGVPGLRFFWPRLWKMWNCLKRANADVYYQRTAGMLTGIVALFCRLHGRRSIFAAAGNPDLQANTPRVETGRDRWLYEFGVKNADIILVQNEEQKRLCRETFGRESTLIPNCYRYSESQIASNDLDRVVLWVSTIRGLKQPHLYLDLAQALPKIQFRMVGGPSRSEPQLFQTVKSRASELRNVEFMGFVSFAESESLFDSASVFVNTSESEGFPNTFLQAWARGVPTVSFVDCGARSDGRPVGQVVRNVQEMSERLVELLTDKVQRDKEGQRCRVYYNDTHSPRAVLGLYEQVFATLARAAS